MNIEETADAIYDAYLQACMDMGEFPYFSQKECIEEFCRIQEDIIVTSRLNRLQDK